MRIAITSRLFFPLKGGVPVIVRLLANAWQEMGHEVRLLTRTPAGDATSPGADCPTVRMPSTGDLLAAARWCDVVFQMEVSMRMIWPFMLLRRPCIISHQTHFDGVSGVSFFRRMQGWIAAVSHPVACSEFVRRCWGGHGIVIGNPYDEQVFHRPAVGVARPHPLLFVGRLVGDKGLDVLFRALAILRAHGQRPKLRVIGDEIQGSTSLLPKWEAEAAALGLADQVTFLGGKDSEDIAAEMRSSQILIVPSTWHEPFGIVALEGLASGCRVIASSGGGLPDAGGSFASYFENGSAENLARVLTAVLAGAAPAQVREAELAAHLARHQASAVAARFVSHFEAALGSPAASKSVLA